MILDVAAGSLLAWVYVMMINYCFRTNGNNPVGILLLLVGLCFALFRLADDQHLLPLFSFPR